MMLFTTPPMICKSIVFYFLLALLFSIIPVNLKFIQDVNGIPVYIVSNGVHTDLVLPAESSRMSWSYFLRDSPLSRNLENAQYISFGWGSREFYVNTPEWKDLKIKTAINALFINGESAMHASVIFNPPTVNARCLKICLPEEQFARLTAYVKTSFAINEAGLPVPINTRGYGPYDLFFEAKGNFNLFRTCNVWTNEGLNRSGIRCALWTPFDIPVLFHLSLAAN